VRSISECNVCREKFVARSRSSESTATSGAFSSGRHSWIRTDSANVVYSQSAMLIREREIGGLASFSYSSVTCRTSLRSCRAGLRPRGHEVPSSSAVSAESFNCDVSNLVRDRCADHSWIRTDSPNVVYSQSAMPIREREIGGLLRSAFNCHVSNLAHAVCARAGTKCFHAPPHRHSFSVFSLFEKLFQTTSGRGSELSSL